MRRSIICWKFSELKFQELDKANQYLQSKRLSQAYEYYTRVTNILKSAQMLASPLFLQASKKSVSCLYLMKKYPQAKDLSLEILNDINQGNFFHFVHYCSSKVLKQNTSLATQKQVQNLAQVFLSKQQISIDEKYKESFPKVSVIAQILNSRADYKRLFVSLIQRAKSNETQEKEIVTNSHSAQLLEGMAILLSSKNLTKHSKNAVNDKINKILQYYEQNDENNVYQPLTVIAMSLIIEKNYMSAEGVIGHILSELNKFQWLSTDKALVKNTYRMLVARANQEDYQQQFSKEQPIDLGLFATQRLISACEDIV